MAKHKFKENHFSEERELIRLARENDSRAFQRLVALHKDMLFSLAMRVLGNREEAEEALQDALVRAFRNIRKYRGEAKFSTWLYRITLNTCRSRLSRAKKRPLSSSLQAPESADQIHLKTAPACSNPQALSETAEFRELISSMLSKLREEYRVALTLFHFNGFHYEEIAEIMDVSLSTVKTYIYRGREQLKSRLVKDPELMEHIDERL